MNRIAHSILAKMSFRLPAVHRHNNLHSRTLRSPGQKPELAAEPLRPRGHRLNPETPQFATDSAESAAVVLDGKQKYFVADFSRNVDVRRAAVSHGIGRRLLGDAVEVGCHIERKYAGTPLLNREHDRRTPKRLDVQFQQSQSAGQSSTFHGDRCEPERQSSGIKSHPPDVLGDRSDVRCNIRGDSRERRVEHHGDTRELLADAVVKITRKPLMLPFDCSDYGLLKGSSIFHIYPEKVNSAGRADHRNGVQGLLPACGGRSVESHSHKTDDVTFYLFLL